MSTKTHTMFYMRLSVGSFPAVGWPLVLLTSLSLPLAWGCTGNIPGGQQGEEAAPPASRDPDVPRPGAGGAGGTTSQCSGGTSASAARWRRLTASQFANTVRDLLGVTPSTSAFLADSRTAAFTTNALRPAQENDVATYSTVAQTTAAKAVANLGTLLGGCNTTVSGGEDKCATQFIKDFGARAFRRPLTDAEQSEFYEVYTAGNAESFAVGIRLVVEAALQSGSFLYMVETGTPDAKGLRKLTGYEIATRLAYLMTGTMPDAALFTAAKAGMLDTAEGVKSYAQKLLASPKSVGEIGKFHLELLGVDSVTDSTAVSKSAAFTEFDASMRQAMADEPRKFVDYVMTKGSGSVEELLSGNYVFPIGALTKVYGTNAKPDADGRAVIADGTRKGLLTLAGTQAVHPKMPSPNAAVNRGHVVREDLLCQLVPSPMVAIEFKEPPGADKMTTQERLRAHLENPTCKGCHQLMDSIGFGFENFNSIGAYRKTDDGGNTIDSSGNLVNAEGGGAFRNVGELTDKLATSPTVRSCLSTQWFRYALGREPTDADACTQEKVQVALSTGKGSIKDALVALVVGDSFRFIGGQ